MQLTRDKRRLLVAAGGDFLNFGIRIPGGRAAHGTLWQSGFIQLNPPGIPALLGDTADHRAFGMVPAARNGPVREIDLVLRGCVEFHADTHADADFAVFHWILKFVAQSRGAQVTHWLVNERTGTDQRCVLLFYSLNDFIRIVIGKLFCGACKSGGMKAFVGFLIGHFKLSIIELTAQYIK